jgi:hypothetical protein
MNTTEGQLTGSHGSVSALINQEGNFHAIFPGGVLFKTALYCTPPPPLKATTYTAIIVSMASICLVN